jgi:tetratricopeptide (TPR) repeat protein
MDKGFIDILKQLVKEQGNAALTDEKKCKALLADYTKNEFQKESRLLVQAVEIGIAKMIDEADELAGCKKAQIRELEEGYGLAPAVAADIVNALALVLRGDATRTVSQSTPHAVTARTHFDQGEMYRSQKEWDPAILEYTKAIQLDPYYAEAYASRGRAYNGNGDNDSALTDCNKAIEVNPNLAIAYIVRGNVHRDHDRAIADYTEAIRLDPNHAIAHNNRGLAYWQKKDYSRAIADYTEAIRLNPNYADAYSNRGNAYFNAKSDYDLAIADYTEAIRLNPNEAHGNNKREAEKATYE